MRAAHEDEVKEESKRTLERQTVFDTDDGEEPESTTEVLRLEEKKHAEVVHHLKTEHPKTVSKLEHNVNTRR
jgi:hypothetical protein